MSKKAIFDHNKLKAIVKEKIGEDISIVKTSKEFDTPQSTILYRMNGGGSDIMCFLHDICTRFDVTIQDIVTIKDE